MDYYKKKFHKRNFYRTNIPNKKIKRKYNIERNTTCLLLIEQISGNIANDL